MVSVNTNTIAFSITLQSDDSGAAEFQFGSPNSRDEPPNTASMCGTLPGSASTTWTSNRANMLRTQATVSFHSVGLAFQGGMVVSAGATVDWLMRESLKVPCFTATPAPLR